MVLIARERARVNCDFVVCVCVGRSDDVQWMQGRATGVDAVDEEPSLAGNQLDAVRIIVYVKFGRRIWSNGRERERELVDNETSTCCMMVKFEQMCQMCCSARGRPTDQQSHTHLRVKAFLEPYTLKYLYSYSFSNRQPQSECSSVRCEN